jgi:hypothetical protein
MRTSALWIVTFSVISTGLGIGCATRTKEAQQLEKDVAAYRARQTQRVEEINQDYRATYAQLTERLVSLGRDELTSAFGIDALHDSDHFITNLDTATLQGQFRDRIEHNVAAQRVKIDQVEAGIEAARKAYADSYEEVQLKLQSLKAVEARVHTLGLDPDKEKELRQTLNKLVAAYKEVRKREKEQAASANQ